MQLIFNKQEATLSDTLIKHPRLLLSELRGGDFAHAGDRDAIDFILTIIESVKGTGWLNCKTILDAGSGFGGTADYLQKMTNSKIHGIDIDIEAIEHSKKKYKHCIFSQGDLININQTFPKEKFDAIFLLNVIYSIEDKIDLLSQFRSILKKDGVLVIFDYCSMHDTEMNTIRDLSTKEIKPIIVDELLKNLPDLKFQCLVNIGLASQFEHWYQKIILQLKTNKTQYEPRYEKKTIEQVTLTFERILKDIESQKIGGVLLLLA